MNDPVEYFSRNLNIGPSQYNSNRWHRFEYNDCDIELYIYIINNNSVLNVSDIGIGMGAKEDYNYAKFGYVPKDIMGFTAKLSSNFKQSLYLLCKLGLPNALTRV